MEVTTIDVESDILEEIKKIISEVIPNKLVWAYGSRVNLNAGKYSDLDLVVFDSNSMIVSDANYKFEESNIPFKVNLILWERIPEDFKENIQNKYFVFQTL